MSGPPVLPPPRIVTQRLVLRPWSIPDAPGLEAALGESVAELLPWVPWATAEAPGRDRVLGLLTTWRDEFASGTCFVYAACDRDERKVLGGVGLYPRVGPDALEIGYWIRSSEAGQGYATEASAALTEAGFALPAVARIEIHCSPHNRASQRVPHKLGYRLAPSPAVPTPEDRGTAVFVLTRDAFVAGAGGA